MRARTSAGSERELTRSKRSCTAVATLLTFWPPGPDARTNANSSSDSSREMREVTAITYGECGETWLVVNVIGVELPLASTLYSLHRPTRSSVKIVVSAILLALAADGVSAAGPPRLFHRDVPAQVRRPDTHRSFATTGWNINFVDYLEAGACLAVQGDGNLVFATFSNTLAVIDISDPSNPQRIGHVQLSGSCETIETYGDYIYCRVWDPVEQVQIVHVGNPSMPAVVGSFPASGYALEIEGSRLYYDDGNNIRIADISNPTSPSLLGSAPFSATDIEARDGILYLAGGLGPEFRIVDATNPASPIPLGTASHPGGGWMLDVAGSYAYVTSGSYWTYVVDASDLANPAIISAFSTYPARQLDVEVADGYALYSDLRGTLRVYDTSDPTALALVAEVSSCGHEEIWSLDVENNRAMLASEDGGFCIFDVTTPNAPVVRGSFEGLSNIRGVDLKDNYLMFSLKNGELLAVNRHGFEHVAKTPGVDAGFWLDQSRITIRNDQAFINTWYSQGFANAWLIVVDVSNPIEPTETGILEVSHSYQTAAGPDHVYMSNGPVRVIDVANPANPFQVAQVPGSARASTLDEPFLFAASGTAGLSVINVSNPGQPAVVVPQFLVDGSAHWITMKGHLAYLVGPSPTSGFWVVDVQNPTSPTLVGSAPIPVTGSGPATVEVRDRYAYVTASGYLRIIDVANPVNPVEVANIETGPIHGPVVVAPPYIYAVADDPVTWSGPLLILSSDFITDVPKASVGYLKLAQNVPNPFNPSTTISFELPSPAHAVLEIFDVHGRIVRTLADKTFPAGHHSVEWDGRNANGRAAGSGVYFYRLRAAGRSEAKKMVILK